MTDENIFVEIAAILGLATVVGILGQKLRQPLIIMFLATGILAGPSCFGIIQSYDQIELLAHIGIALLLFIVGLKLDLNLIRTTGPVALVWLSSITPCPPRPCTENSSSGTRFR